MFTFEQRTAFHLEVSMNLCQLNIAKPKASLDDSIMNTFVNGLDYVNALADNHDGFVWRSTANYDGKENPFGAGVLVNMSIWTSAQHLRDYVYKSGHMEYLKRKAEWFHRIDNNVVYWWVPEGYIPTLEEGKAKLDLLARSGPSPEAFRFADALAGKHRERVA